MGVEIPINDLLARLKTIEGINFVHIWNNQFRFMDEQKSYSFPFPCLFLEIVNRQESNELGVGYQESDIDWCIHIGQDQYDANNGQGDQEQNLSIFDLRNLVIRKLNLYKPPACGHIFKTGEEQDYEHTNVYHHKVYFRCGFIDGEGSLDTNAGYIVKPPPTIWVPDVQVGQDLFLLDEAEEIIEGNGIDIFTEKLTP